MLRAERRARRYQLVVRQGANPAADVDHCDLSPKLGTPERAVNAIVPILVLIFAIIAGMVVDGTMNLNKNKNSKDHSLNVT